MLGNRRDELPDPAGQRAGNGFFLIIIATAIVGLAGYVITWLVPRSVGVGRYAAFAVFWSFVFLVAAALSGIQQETTRATVRATSRLETTPRARAGVFAVGSSVVTAALISATAPLWVGLVFGSDWRMVWPLVVGGASYVLLAVLAGTLYGISQWRSIFWVMTIEGVLRLVLVGLVLTVTSEPVPLAWAVVAPFAFTALVMWLIVRRGLVGATALDAGYRRLAWNATRTIVAAGSMGLLVSGFPLLLAITSPRETQSQLGLLILAATLTRAPLIVVGMALQSYFIVLFRNSGLRFWRLFLQLEAIVIIAGLVLGCLGWLIGPAVFSFLFPNQPSPPGWLIGVLVSTSALIGAICVSAPAVLSRGKHSVFTAGWVVAGVTTFFGLLLPLPLYERASIALLVGPLAGLAVHVTDLIAFHRRPLAPEALEPASPHIHG